MTIKDGVKRQITSNVQVAVRESTSQARSIVFNLIEHQPIMYDKAQIFWVWNTETFGWEIVDETELLVAIDEMLQSQGRTFIGTSESKLKSEIIEEMRKAGRRKFNSIKPLPSTCIQFRSKIYDIASRTQGNATHDFFITNPIPYDVGQNEDTPTISKIFDSWVGSENTQTLYQVLAYCCLADYPLQRIFLLHGSGSNGKSCFLDLMLKFLGNQNCASLDLEDLLKDNHATYDLYKKLVCLMGETDFVEMKRTNLLKKLSGNDLIRYRPLHKKAFHDKNYAKILIATNSIPITQDKTDGYYRRWLIIDFPNKFTEKFDILSTIPETEYNNLAKRILSILYNLLQSREFHNEGTIEDRKRRYEEKSNPLRTFIDECCDVNVNYDMPFFEFQDAFVYYLKDRGYRELSNKVISEQLKKLGFDLEKRNVDTGEKRTKWNFVIGLKMRPMRPMRPQNEINSYIGKNLEEGSHESHESQQTRLSSLNKQQTRDYILMLLDQFDAIQYSIVCKMVHGHTIINELLKDQIVMESPSGYFRLIK